MLKKILPIIILISLFSFKAKANFDFNNNCIEAYHAIFDLRINDAKALINKEKSIHPNNGVIVLLENYADYFTLLVSENESDYNRLKNIKNSRIAALENQSKDSPYYLFAQAEVYLQWGLIKSRFQDYFLSGLDFKKAKDLLDENIKKYPDFQPNIKSRALIEVIMGAVPANLKGLLSTFGFRGNINKGEIALEQLYQALSNSKYSFYKKEVVFQLCLIDNDIVSNPNNFKKLINYVNTMPNTSLLKVFLKAHILQKNGHNDESIDLLLNRPKNASYLSFPVLNYLLGSAKYNRMDSDANVYLIYYLKEYKGINYVKDAYLKLAYYYLLRGDNSHYQAFIKMVKTQGNLFDEKDKQALKEANEGNPNIDLLKARLYFDGGYYDKCLNVLNHKNYNEFNLKRDQIEYYYRLGRVYDKLNQDDKALINYQKSINLGQNTSYFFASNAALMMGKIYESKGDKKNAVNAYKLAASMKNHEYQNSIETQAKEALNRLD
ncbi:MAG: tetratricopeptide repeat protein [Sphingobacteriales bacterium]|nr:tetratricopeptide repeat protein [Sphingobacteriales bacterium]